MTTKTKATKMDKAAVIVASAYADSSIKNPRAHAIAEMMSKLGMEKTTAATYHGHCLRYAREADLAAALEKAEKGKPVYSAVKVNAHDEVTSVGVFLTRKAASEFNSDYRHDGIEKGIVEVGTTLPGLYDKRRKAIEKAFKKTA